jgi:3-oxoadipate enol-lactonase/4-carboxymuconolactone decarboxylase
MVRQAHHERVSSMKIVDRGSGPPLVVIPGLQGRWEYVAPAVDALAAHFRVLTFPLCDEPSADYPCDLDRGLDAFVDQVIGVLDHARERQATICGISFGGLIAARVAALHPSRTTALILVSTPPFRMNLKRRHRIYVRLPWVLGPLLLLEAPWRLGPELRRAIPDPAARRRFSLGALKTLVRAPVSVSRMAARTRLITRADPRGDCERIASPALVVTGEPGLDYVVPTDGSSEYARLIPGARSAVLDDTGHLGSVTRPVAFATIVRDFVAREAGLRWPDAAA